MYLRSCSKKYNSILVKFRKKFVLAGKHFVALKSFDKFLLITLDLLYHQIFFEKYVN